MILSSLWLRRQPATILQCQQTHKYVTDERVVIPCGNRLASVQGYAHRAEPGVRIIDTLDKLRRAGLAIYGHRSNILTVPMTLPTEILLTRREIGTPHLTGRVPHEHLSLVAVHHAERYMRRAGVRGVVARGYPRRRIRPCSRREGGMRRNKLDAGWKSWNGRAGRALHHVAKQQYPGGICGAGQARLGADCAVIARLA
eukprot:5396984-Pyramimonas_sp.AAC.1